MPCIVQVQRTTTMGHQEQQQVDAASEACSRLEQAMGLSQSMDSSVLPLSTRVGAVTEMAEMMTAEMQSMQEQHSVAATLHSLDAEAVGRAMQRDEQQQVSPALLNIQVQAPSAALRGCRAAQPASREGL